MMVWRSQLRFDPVLRLASLLGLLAFTLHIAASVACAQTPTIEIRMLDGSKAVGTMVGVTLDQLKLESDAGSMTVAVEQIEAIKFSKSEAAKTPKTAAQFYLLDGSSVFIDKYNYADQKIAATLTTGNEVSIPKRNVSSIVFAGDRSTIRKQVEQVKRDSDVVADTLIVLRNGEFNAIEGIVKGLNPKSVQFAIEEQSADVPISKLSAITFFKASKDDFSDPLATCVLSDTSRIMLRGFELTPKQLVLTSLTGEKFNVAFNKVTSLEFNSTTAVPLANLTPSTNDWEPLLAGQAVVEKLRQLRIARINQSFSGQPLSLRVPRPEAEVEAGKTRTVERVYDSGFAVQGGGRLAWRLDGDYQSLSGLIGFAPQASEHGRVKVQILVDGKEHYTQELVNNEMTEPQAFEIDLVDSQRMIIEIDYADGRSIGDVIHLVNPTLQK